MFGSVPFSFWRIAERGARLRPRGPPWPIRGERSESGGSLGMYPLCSLLGKVPNICLRDNYLVYMSLMGHLKGSTMVTNEIRKVRCRAVLDQFLSSSRGCVFFTLTTPDVVDLEEIRARWRGLRHWLSRMLGKDVKYVMNYEVHPLGHGWHIHSVWNCYIDLRKHLKKIQSFGFGRVDVRKVDSVGVSEYLTKHALKAYAKRCKCENGVKRARLVNASRKLPVLSDWHYDSEWLRQEKHFLKLLIKADIRPDFLECSKLSRLAVACRCRSIFDVLDLYSAMFDTPDNFVQVVETFASDYKIEQDFLQFCENDSQKCEN